MAFIGADRRRGSLQGRPMWTPVATGPGAVAVTLRLAHAGRICEDPALSPWERSTKRTLPLTIGLALTATCTLAHLSPEGRGSFVGGLSHLGLWCARISKNENASALQAAAKSPRLIWFSLRRSQR